MNVTCPHCHSSRISRRKRRNSLGYRTFACRECHRTFNERTMGSFNRRQYPTDAVVLAVIWRLRYKLSLRDVAEMLLQRGFTVRHETIRAREFRFAPLVAERLRARQRAEPGFRRRKLADVEAEWAQEDAERAARLAEERQARERRKVDYGPELEQSRLVLLELEGWLATEQVQCRGLIDGTLFPSMDARLRTDRVSACDREIAVRQRRVDEFREAVAVSLESSIKSRW